MRKVITSDEMIRIEKNAYRDGWTPFQFIEVLSDQIVKDFLLRFSSIDKFIFICGKGFNGLDALMVAYRLHKLGKSISIYLVFERNELLKESLEVLDLLDDFVSDINCEFPFCNEKSVIVDGVFGTGFKGKLPFYLSVLFLKIRKNSQSICVSLDIPSGINGNCGEFEEAFFADYTYVLGIPKLGLFSHKAWNYVGKIILIDFGLPQKYQDDAHQYFDIIEKQDCIHLLPQVLKSNHKYQVGYVLGFCGSLHMLGAAILSGSAALRSGCGIVRLITALETDVSFSSCPDIIFNSFSSLQELLLLFEKEVLRANCCLVGCGIGRDLSNIKILKYIFEIADCPLVIDGDALFLSAQACLNFPKKSVLTPHEGEMEYLLNQKLPQNLLEKSKIMQSFVDEHDVIVVLKGPCSFIWSAFRSPLLFCHGSSFMAKAGSGDVLAGMLSSFIAQGLSSLDAAILGVYFHSFCGSIALEDHSFRSFLASDLLTYIPKAFNAFKTI